MTNKELQLLLVNAARPSASASVDFSDVSSAARNALIEHFGIESMDIRDIKKHRSEIFAIIEEVIEQVLPAMLEERIGQFAEIKTFGRDETPLFTIKNLGKNRVALGIVKGARGGIYRARRLDERNLMVPTYVETIAYQITLEELLAGRRTVADLLEIITRGFTENIYIEVVKALRAAYANVPAANKGTGTGIDDVELKRVIRTVSAYGKPVIMGFQSEVEKLANVHPVANTNPNVPTADLDDLRNRGYVVMYQSTPVVVIPNYFVDESNTQWVFEERDLFILPVDEKPVKVALHGEVYTAEVAQPHGGMEWHAHRLLGIAILFYNAIGIYRDATASGGLY